MKSVLVVGSGAAGATVAKELQGSFSVTVLEEGADFRPFLGKLSTLEKVKGLGLPADARWTRYLFPTMEVRKTPDSMIVVNGRGTGGSTTITAGNAVRCDHDLKEIGVDLDAEFAELYREIPVTSETQAKWSKTTQQMFSLCRGMGLNTESMPKMINVDRCSSCGRCLLGCVSRAKWDCRTFLSDATDRGATLMTRARVDRVVVEDNKAVGVVVRSGLGRKVLRADLVVLAAGGFSTPSLLANSGIACEETLWIDPIVCVAGKLPGAGQDKELTMPFVVQADTFLISPYFDFLSFFFNRGWRNAARDTYSLMVKIADEPVGKVSKKRVLKTLTARDNRRLDDGVALCREIFKSMGCKDMDIVPGSKGGGHPSGMLPLSADSSKSLRPGRLPDNLYVADASLLPKPLGKPPMFTIMALARKVGRAILSQYA